MYVSKPAHRYETRFSRSNYVAAPYISKIGESSIKVIGPKCWTNISTDLKKLPFRKTFSKQLKKLYLSELPTEKRTRNLNLPKTKEVEMIPDVEVILSTSIYDSTFFGFWRLKSCLICYLVAHISYSFFFYFIYICCVKYWLYSFSLFVVVLFISLLGMVGGVCILTGIVSSNFVLYCFLILSLWALLFLKGSPLRLSSGTWSRGCLWAAGGPS